MDRDNKKNQVQAPINMSVPINLSTYEESLRVWEQYDCRGVDRSRGDNEMREMWRRWLRTRGKPTSATRTVTQSSLDKYSAAFVRRWNTEAVFAKLVPLREERLQRYGLTESREMVCELSWDSDHPACTVHWQKNCRNCGSYGTARPSRAQWTAMLVECTLTDDELTWAGRYTHNLEEF